MRVNQIWATLEAEFLTRVVVVRERMALREQEVHGSWMTEAKMTQKGYSAFFVCMWERDECATVHANL